MRSWVETRTLERIAAWIWRELTPVLPGLAEVHVSRPPAAKAASIGAPKNGRTAPLPLIRFSVRNKIGAFGLLTYRNSSGEAVMTSGFNRRQIVGAASGLAAAGLFAPAQAIAEEKEKQEEKMEEVTPPEDLMREHGVLNRVLLIYEAVLRRFASNESLDPSIVSGSAQIIRSFIEDYHEINEQNYVFPRSGRPGKWLISSISFACSIRQDAA